MAESDQVPHVRLTHLPVGNSGHVLVESLCSSYAEVYSEHPWHENLMCPSCERYWGNPEELEPKGGYCDNCSRSWSDEVRTAVSQRVCLVCQTPLVPFWPAERVKAELEQGADPRFPVHIAVTDGGVVGFCWGFSSSISKLEDMLKLEVGQELRRLFGETGPVFYQHDIGVLAPFRSKRIISGLSVAEALFWKRHSDAVVSDLATCVARVRQSPKPSRTYVCYTTRYGYRIVKHYPHGDGRVVIAQRTVLISSVVAQEPKQRDADSLESP